MTGSAADPPEFQPHLHTKDVQRAIKARAKDPDDPLELVIVRDMWLTGFDAPAMHTMYVDKPMQGAGLMQAIARVNRTFRDKPGGLIVDYLGIAPKLRNALAEYSPSDRDQAGVPIEEMVWRCWRSTTSSRRCSTTSTGRPIRACRPRSGSRSCGT